MIGDAAKRVAGFEHVATVGVDPHEGSLGGSLEQFEIGGLLYNRDAAPRADFHHHLFAGHHGAVARDGRHVGASIRRGYGSGCTQRKGGLIAQSRPLP